VVLQPLQVAVWDPGPGWVGGGSGSGSGGSSGGGGSTAVPNNPANVEPTANCGTSAPTRMTHAQSDIAHARLQRIPRQRYSNGQILLIRFGDNSFELYEFTTNYSPPIPVPNTCISP